MSQMRMSIMQPTPNAKGRKQQEEDNFMTLPDREVVDCLSDIGFAFTLSDLQKPNPQHIQRIFEFFVELSLNATRTTVAPAMKAAADDICGEYSDIFSADTRDMMGFFVICRRMLQECGITDFSLNDLYRPTRERLVKIFSHVINFLRFRESQAHITDEHFNKADKTKQRIEVLYSENQAKEEHLADLDRNRRAMEALIADKENRSNELKSRLIELKHSQERVSDRLEQVKQEQSRLKAAFEATTTAKLTAQQESEKLRPYTTLSPAVLENQLKDLTSALSHDKAQTDLLDRRARALQASSDAFSTVTADVEVCTSLLHDLQRDLAAEEEIRLAASKTTEALNERKENVLDMTRQERQLQKQLENVLAKTEKVRVKDEQRKEADGQRMKEMINVSEELRRNRNDTSREMERRKARIEQTEKKMADLKENIEAEVNSAQAEYTKMESHIKLYIEEMEQSTAC